MTVQIKGTVDAACLSHPQTSPRPGSTENLLPRNLVPGAQEAGDGCPSACLSLHQGRRRELASVPSVVSSWAWPIQGPGHLRRFCCAWPPAWTCQLVGQRGVCVVGGSSQPLGVGCGLTAPTPTAPARVGGTLRPTAGSALHVACRGAWSLSGPHLFYSVPPR